MNNINAILDFLVKVATATLSQLVWLLGVIFVFGLLLFLFARFTRTTYVKAAGELGRKLDIFITGWIGTPVHELGHALFCVLFRHKITEMKLYSPNSDDGTLGYVAHNYNPKSRYQRIGNFFIGIGPVLFGAVALYALMYFLMPGMLSLFASIEERGADVAQSINSGNWKILLDAFIASLGGITAAIFDVQNFSNWRFWVFIYLSFCVASHIELSPPDIKGAAGGLLTFVLTVLALNLIVMGVEAFGYDSFAGGYWQYIKLETYATHINAFLGAMGALLTYALIISALNFVLSYVALGVYSLVKEKRLVNPFWG